MTACLLCDSDDGTSSLVCGGCARGERAGLRAWLAGGDADADLLDRIPPSAWAPDVSYTGSRRSRRIVTVSLNEQGALLLGAPVRGFW